MSCLHGSLAVLALAFSVIRISASQNVSLAYNDPDDEIEHFKIGLLAPWENSFGDFSALTSASAVSIAMEKIHAHPVMGKRMKFRYFRFYLLFDKTNYYVTITRVCQLWKGIPKIKL